jgi:tetratricopeptide (TPR) repeat protein
VALEVTALAARDEERLGWKLLEEGRLEEAEGHFRRSLELDPGRIDALNGLGSVYLRWNELDEAAELFQMAIALAEPMLPRRRRRAGWQDPALRPYLRALYSLAMTRIRRGAFAEALYPLEELIDWDPNGLDGEAFLLLGQCRQRLGFIEAAHDCYEKARGRHAHAWYLHGLTAFLLGRPEEAAHSFKMGATLLPEVGPLLAYYPRVVGFPGRGGESHRRAVKFVETTVSLWSPESRAYLREVLFPVQEAVP